MERTIDIQTTNTRLYLSPRAQAALAQAAGTTKTRFHAMLDRIRNPQWRGKQGHSFDGTDLDVYGRGNTTERLAGWAEGDAVYVAELFPNHDDYERQLRGRNRIDYNEFQPWPPSQKPDVPSSQAQENKRLRAAEQDRAVAVEGLNEHARKSERELQRVRKERDEAYRKIRESQETIERVSAERDEALKTAKELRDMGLGGRLRWLLTGRRD